MASKIGHDGTSGRITKEPDQKAPINTSSKEISSTEAITLFSAALRDSKEN